MTAQTIPFVSSQSDWTDHQPERLASAIPTALISDSALLHSGLQHILRDTPFAIAEAASVTGPKRLYHCAHHTALVIIEVSQNTGRVLEIVKQAREQAPEARIVALADQFDSSFVRLGHEAGVDGFCLAAADPEVLIKSFELVMLGETVVPSAVIRPLAIGATQDQGHSLQDHTAEPKLSDLKACKLSAREMEILHCLMQGASNKMIARKCDVTEATIKVHVKAILRKIGASNRTQAAMWASQRLPQRGGGQSGGCDHATRALLRGGGHA
jgi:two-component system, NarL family, nitrate/nitrite response regulator NarL